jgi:lipoyl(octanoyl) transferase
MILHQWGSCSYEEARRRMDEVHRSACEDGENHLILVQHPKVFTVGRDDWERSWEVETLKSDRGGSITCHSEGQHIYYFCFQSPLPASFFRKVIRVFENFFSECPEDIFYDRNSPGFYIENRKIASLGFRYKNGVSLHGVAVNVDVDLDFHAQVPPCDLQGIIPTSLKYEGIAIDREAVDQKVITSILDVFDESL